MTDLARRIAVARGDEPADLVVKGGRVLSVFTREWLDVDIAVCDGYVAGLGDYEGTETLDVGGAFVVPGFIDAHMHLESTKLLVDEFARLVLPMGTTAVVADPHEIANVLGSDGIHWLLDVWSGLPLYEQGCSGCGDQILGAQAIYVFSLADLTFAFHIGCYGLWLGELVRRGLYRPT